jgi:hypothetical protein
MGFFKSEVFLSISLFITFLCCINQDGTYWGNSITNAIDKTISDHKNNGSIAKEIFFSG